MGAVAAKNLPEKFAGAVGDLGLRGEVRGGSHEYGDVRNTADAIDAARNLRGRREGVNTGDTRVGIAVLRGDFRAEFSGGRQLAVHER